MVIDGRVAPFLGRVLDAAGEPAGTCFQVGPGVLVTAFHVLEAVGAAWEGAAVRFDPLQGGRSRQAEVRQADPHHDLAVLWAGEPLTASVAGLVRTDQVLLGTPVAVTGVAAVDDPGHTYRNWDAGGYWAGGAVRDEAVLLGRLAASAVMRGMSGAPVLTGGLVAGVVSARYNSADGWGRDSVWVVRTEDLMPLLARSGTGPVTFRSAVPLAPALPTDPALSADVVERYRPELQAAALAAGVPAQWTRDQLKTMLEKARDIGPETSKSADILTALCEALEAKPAFMGLGGSRLELAQLQVAYRREIGTWPDGGSADALLAEAAGAGIAERRDPSAPRHPGALARFLAAVAALQRTSPLDSEPVARWAAANGHQLGDLQAHYAKRLDDTSWLVIDLGDESRPGAEPWPSALSWVQLTADGPAASDQVTCEPSEAGLLRALRSVLLVAPPARRLLVDLVVPRALMDKGIERWPLVEAAEGHEPLFLHCAPRLRWSRRRRDVRLQYRLMDRVDQASWAGDARSWVRPDPRNACLLAGRSLKARADPLQAALRDGCGFIIWFPGGMPSTAVRRISEIVATVPVPARRGSLPEQLPGFRQSHPAVIWDDPDGRGGLRLPTLTALESP